MTDSRGLSGFSFVKTDVVPEHPSQFYIDALREGACDKTFMNNGMLGGLFVDECIVASIDPNRESVAVYGSPVEAVKNYSALEGLAALKPALDRAFPENKWW